MHRAARQLALLDRLGDGAVHRAADLASALGCAPRTIYRDVADLIAGGIAIEGAAGLGYVLRDPASRTLPRLDAEDAALLHFALGLVARGDDAELAARAASLRARLLDGRPEGAVSVYARREPIIALPALRSAIAQRHKVRLAYADEHGQSTERLIRPLHLEMWERVWTCTAWCDLRDGFRSFRVDRITRFTPTTIAFRPEPGRTYADYLATLLPSE